MTGVTCCVWPDISYLEHRFVHLVPVTQRAAKFGRGATLPAGNLIRSKSFLEGMIGFVGAGTLFEKRREKWSTMAVKIFSVSFLGHRWQPSYAAPCCSQ